MFIKMLYTTVSCCRLLTKRLLLPYILRVITNWPIPWAPTNHNATKVRHIRSDMRGRMLGAHGWFCRKALGRLTRSCSHVRRGRSLMDRSIAYLPFYQFFLSFRYIVYFLLDSTFGLFFIYISVKISQCIVKLCGCKTLYFGEYGTPPKCESFIGQCGVFVLIVIVEKVVITLFASLKFWSEVSFIWILFWISY